MEIIWFFGASGSGKETIINNIMMNKDRYGKGLINLQNEVLEIRESIDYIGQYVGDPIVKLRNGILDSVKLYKKKDTYSLLIKGQSIDLDNYMPEKVFAIVPNITHKIIFLYAPYKILLERCRRKNRWNESYEMGGEESFMRRLEETQINKLKQIKHFKTTFVDSSDYGYKIISKLW